MTDFNKQYIKEAKAIILRMDELEDNSARYIPSMLKKEVQICNISLAMLTKGLLIGLGEYEEETPIEDIEERLYEVRNDMHLNEGCPYGMDDCANCTAEQVRQKDLEDNSAGHCNREAFVSEDSKEIVTISSEYQTLPSQKKGKILLALTKWVGEEIKKLNN